MFQKAICLCVACFALLAISAELKAQQFYKFVTPADANGDSQVCGLMRIEFQESEILVDLINGNGHCTNQDAILQLRLMTDSGATLHSANSSSAGISSGPIVLGGLYETPSGGWGFASWVHTGGSTVILTPRDEDDPNLGSLSESETALLQQLMSSRGMGLGTWSRTGGSTVLQPSEEALVLAFAYYGFVSIATF